MVNLGIVDPIALAMAGLINEPLDWYGLVIEPNINKIN